MKQESADLVNTTTYGVTPTGFVYKPYTVIYNELSTAMKNAFGEDLDTSIDTPNGQLIGLIAAALASLWQQENAIYDAYNPNAATGVSLTNIGVITFTPRNNESKSVVEVVITGTPNTFIPSAIAQISVDQNPSAAFKFLNDITIPVSGTVTTQAEALNFGSVAAPANTLTQIDTPFAGWASVNNPQAATLGRNTETDPQYRVRRNNSAALASQNTEDSLRAELLSLSGVIDAVVLVNQLNVTDSNGFLPHSIAAIVEGGEDDLIAQKIYGRSTSSISTNGDITVNIANNAGILIPVNFYRNVQIDIYIRIEIIEYTGFPVDGLIQIQQNVYDYLVGTNNGNIPIFGMGATIIISQLYTPINLTPGASVSGLFLDKVDPPINTADLVLTFKELPVFSLDNILVVGI